MIELKGEDVATTECDGGELVLTPQNWTHLFVPADLGDEDYFIFSLISIWVSGHHTIRRL